MTPAIAATESPNPASNRSASAPLHFRVIIPHELAWQVPSSSNKSRQPGVGPQQGHSNKGAVVTTLSRSVVRETSRRTVAFIQRDEPLTDQDERPTTVLTLSVP